MSGPAVRIEEGGARHTLARPVSREGTGLHSGRSVGVELRPAEAGTGIRFRRMDLEDEPVLAASVRNVTGVEWETVLGKGEGSVRTVEHVLAAVAAFRVDDLEIALEGPEPPALDGSSAPWCEALAEAGREEIGGTVEVLAVTRPIEVTEGDSTYSVTPYDGYRASAEIRFEHPTIGSQFASVAVEAEAFCDEIAAARTFGLESWHEPLKEKGLALGASHENTVVLTDDGLATGVELRRPDEFVRHKLIDMVGDLALVGLPVRGHVLAVRPGHRGNVALARRLAREAEAARTPGPVLDIHEILEYIPHRYPFLLVDRIVEFEAGRRILGLKNVTINEPFFQGHFPGHPVMPGVLIVEAMGQVGGLLLMNEFERPEEKVVYFMSLDDVKWRKPVFPGDQILFELEMLRFRGRICRMHGTARVDGDVVAEATMMAQVVDR
ncbi:MAG TPA: UDP-3-O-acyl-N-acetylglucosamine deacetylase [Gemmatimonadota bacterium]|nr:UDP-3-O-acyl-N-acetylglucosamine deacetylase [Gemmatimonadota bacterium]